MFKNRYNGIDSYAVSYSAYKATILIKTPHFSYNDFEDLQQELILAYLYAESSFDETKGDKRSFIKTVINNTANRIIETVETSKRWSGINEISLFETVDEKKYLFETLPDENAYISDDSINLELIAKDMPEDLKELMEYLKLYTIREISEKTGIAEQTMFSRLKRLRKYLKDFDL